MAKIESLTDQTPPAEGHDGRERKEKLRKQLLAARGSKEQSALKIERLTAQIPRAEVNGGGTRKRKLRARLFLALAVSSLTVVGVVSWFFLYLTSLNPGD